MSQNIKRLENKFNLNAMFNSSKVAISLERGGKGNVASEKTSYTHSEKKYTDLALENILTRNNKTLSN